MKPLEAIWEKRRRDLGYGEARNSTILRECLKKQKTSALRHFMVLGRVNINQGAILPLPFSHFLFSHMPL